MGYMITFSSIANISNYDARVKPTLR